MTDKSRFKLWVKSRQIGGSFASAFEIVNDCICNDKTEWVVISAKEDLAKEYLKRAVTCANACIPVYKLRGVNVTAEPTASELKFSNGSRILAIPANPGTARSYSANVLLDEFAHHENADEIWGAVYPMITNQIRGKLKLRIISTPNGTFNRFFRIWAGENDFSKHFTTIHDAIAQGFDANVDELRRNLGSDGAADFQWKQEFECQFLEGTDAVSIIKSTDLDDCLSNPPLEWKKNYSCAFVDHGQGSNKTAVAIVNGNRLIYRESWVDINTMASAGRIIKIFKDNHLRPEHTYGDDGGGGHVINDRLHEIGWGIGRVLNQKDSSDDRYINIGAEQWFNMAKLLADRHVIFGQWLDDSLRRQLINRFIDFRSDGKLAAEKKEKMAARGVASPDDADAVCGAFYFNRFVHGESQREWQQHRFYNEGASDLPSGFEAGLF